MKNIIRQGGAAAILVSAFVMQFLFCDLYSQSSNDYRSRSSGNWTDASNWQRYYGSAWVTATVPPDSGAGCISILAGHTIAYNSQDIAVNQLVIEAGAQLNVNSGVYFITGDGAGDEVTVYGTLYYTGNVASPMPGSGTVKSGGAVIFYSSSSPANLVSFFAVKEAGSNWVYRGSSTTLTTVSLSGRTYANLSFESISGIYTFNFTGVSPLVVEGNFLLGSGVAMTVTNTAVNVFKGNYTVLGSMSYSTGIQTFTFAGTGEQVLSGNSTLNFENISTSAGSNIKLNSNLSVSGTMNASGTVDCGEKTIGGAGAFNLLSGGTLKTAHANGVNGSIVCATSGFAADACYELNGTSAQITGSKLTSCGNLRINNTSGVSLSAPVSVSGAVYFISGKLYSGNYSLTLGNTGITSGAGQDSYFVTNGTGNLEKLSLPIGSDFLFPVGKSTYTPVTINYTGTADNFSVRTTSTLDFIVNCSTYVKKKWIISEGSPGGSTALVKLTWNSSDQNPESNPSGGVCLLRYDGSALDEVSATVAGSGPYTASANGFSQLGEFAVGNESTLPAEMISFESFVSGNKINLSWKTSAENNCSGYYIERKDAFSGVWDTRGFVKSQESPSGVKTYHYSDEVSEAGKYLFRLKQTDVNGSFAYYYIKDYCTVKPPEKFRLSGSYPNPFNSGCYISYEIPEECRVSINFFDIAGRKIREAYFRAFAGYSKRYFDFSGFTSGVYIYYIKALLSGGIMSAVGKCVR